MNLKPDLCPRCGGSATVVGKQAGNSGIIPENARTILFVQPIYHVVCRTCGTVIRSFVKQPEELE